MLAALWSIVFLNLGFPAYGPSVINTAMARALGLNRETLGNMLSGRRRRAVLHAAAGAYRRQRNGDWMNNGSQVNRDAPYMR